MGAGGQVAQASSVPRKVDSHAVAATFHVFVSKQDSAHFPGDTNTPQLDVPRQTALTIQGIDATAADLEFTDFIPTVCERRLVRERDVLSSTFRRVLLTVIISPNAP